MIPYDLEERVEDALEAYLLENLDNMRVYKYGDTSEQQYPSVAIAAVNTEPQFDEAEYDIRRNISVMLRVACEGPELNAGGTEIQTAREHNARARANVIEHLSCKDLHTEINNVNSPGVHFSMAHLASVSRSVEDRLLISVIELDVNANPKDLEA